MTPHKQLIKHDPANGRFGDCHRTCIAVILDLHPSEVPHFMDGCRDNAEAPEAMDREKAWMDQHGFAVAHIPYAPEAGLEAVLEQIAFTMKDVPMILGGKSSLGVGHSVVVMNGEIVCDPSGNGIVGPMQDGYYWLSIISVGPAWNARGIKRRKCPHGDILAHWCADCDREHREATA